MLRVIALCFALILFNVVAAQDNGDYTIPTPPNDVNLDLVIGRVGQEVLTLGEFSARLRYERLRYYVALLSLVEQMGEEALNIQDPTNQFAAPIEDLLIALTDDDQFPALIYDTLMVELLYRQEAEQRNIEVDSCELEQLWALRLGIQDPSFNCEALPEGFEDLRTQYYAEAVTYAGLTNEQVDESILAVAQYQAVVDALRLETPIDLLPARRSRHIRVETEEQAQAIYDQLQDGATFEELLAQFTLDVGAVGNRGELGLIGRGDTVPEFEEAAFDAEVGTIAGPAETTFGYHVIRVNSRLPVAVAQQIVVSSERDAQQISELLDSGASFADLAQRFSIDTATSTRGGNLGAFTPDRLLPELSEVIFGTASVGLLEPIQTDLGYHIIEVVDYDPAGLVDVAHILLATEAEAQEVIELINDGADFNEIAEARSIDPSAAGTRGDTLTIFTGGEQSGLYVFEETGLPIDRAVFAEGVQEGDVLAPVQVGQFWLVLKVDEISERLPQSDSVELARRFYLQDWEAEQYATGRVQETTLWRRYAPFDLLPSEYDVRLAQLDEEAQRIRAEFLSSTRSNNLINILAETRLERAETE